MSRKTVSRGATTTLVLLLTLASAAPGFAAPRPAGGRGSTIETGVWSLVLDLSQRLAGWAFGVQRSPKAPAQPNGIHEKAFLGVDPNGNSVAVDPLEPIGGTPVFGGG